MASSQTQPSKPKIVSPAEWLEARKQLLAKEKEFTRQRDQLSRLRREMPWVKVEKDYVFDSPSGAQRLASLFGSRSQLIVYHFMLGPGWQEGCPSCSMIADHFDGMAVHLNHRDVTLAVVSRAPLAGIQAFQQRLGWRFPWVSSFKNDFNHDYQVHATKEEIASGTAIYNYSTHPFPGATEERPGLSVFHKDAAGDIFHTYSAYARGLDILLGVYNFLDLVPKGRDEQDLPYTMAWVRHHDRYASDYVPLPAAGKS